MWVAIRSGHSRQRKTTAVHLLAVMFGGRARGGLAVRGRLKTIDDGVLPSVGTSSSLLTLVSPAPSVQIVTVSSKLQHYQ